MSENHNNTAFWLIGAGLVFLILNTTSLSFGGLISDFWPLALVVLGLTQMRRNHDAESSSNGRVMVIVGLVLLLFTVDLFAWGAVGSWWPLALIAVGAAMLLGWFQNDDGNAQDAAPVDTETAARPTQNTRNPSDKLSLVAVFSSSERHYTSSTFSGGEATAVFGSIDIDLRDAQLSQARISIELNAVFGSIRLRVPADWKLEHKDTAIFGKVTHPRDARAAEQPTLVIEANSVFGKVDIE